MIPKTIGFLSGKTLASCQDIQAIFEERGILTQPLSFYEASSSLSLPEILILRGPMRSHPQFALDFYEDLREWSSLRSSIRQQKVKICGLGSGAALVLSDLAKENGFHLSWKPWPLSSEGAWTSVFAPEDPLPWLSLSFSQLLPEETSLEPLKLSPWLSTELGIVGWKANNSLMLSMLDIFAFAERQQHPHFGFRDLSLFATRTDVLEKLLGIWASRESGA